LTEIVGGWCTEKIGAEFSMIEKNVLIKLFIVALAIWFAFGAIYMVIPNPFATVCREKCSAQGFDVVLTASAEQCRCYSTIDRAEKIIENT